MKTFTIENETGNITIHTSVQEAEAVPDTERFGSEGALAKLAARWPATRLVEIWNSLPGATPVIRNRSSADTAWSGSLAVCSAPQIAVPAGASITLLNSWAV